MTKTIHPENDIPRENWDKSDTIPLKTIGWGKILTHRDMFGTAVSVQNIERIGMLGCISSGSILEL